MKKVKLMVTGIAVLAIVGGALAFKAKTYGQAFCTAPETQTDDACQGSFIGKLGSSGTVYKYTTTTNVNNCANIASCTNTTTLTSVE